MVKLAPSILSADFNNLLFDVEDTHKAGAAMLHVDVMDGHFVPNITIGPLVPKAISEQSKIPLDIHLMIENPEHYIKDFVFETTEYITVHVEACTHLHRTIQQIKALGIKAGVSLNPATSHETLKYIIKDVDLVLVMSVNPGFGGQSFIESSIDKVKEIKKMIVESGSTALIEIDGGVNLENANEILDAGVDILVAGSAVFSEGDIAKNTKAFLELR